MNIRWCAQIPTYGHCFLSFSRNSPPHHSCKQFPARAEQLPSCTGGSCGEGHEQQIHRWRHRLPDLSDDHSRERLISAVEVKEDLDRFKDITVEKVREVNNALCALEREVQLFERARDESWEAGSQRVSTLVDGSVSALSERLNDLEHTVQSRMTTPVTEERATHVETWTTIEQALLSEIGKVRDEHADHVQTV